jgi:hypothetical protein
MPRLSKIEELGIGERVKEAFERLQDYTDVAKELNEDGYSVSMQQVRNFLGPMQRPEPKKESDGDMEVALDEPIIEYPMAPSIFDVMMIADNNYRYLATRLNRYMVSTKVAVSTISEIRKHLEFVTNAMAKAAEYEETIVFGQEVIKAISEADPGVAKKILENLRQRNALRAAITKPRDSDL